MINITVRGTYRDTTSDSSQTAKILTPVECKDFIGEYKKALQNGNIRRITWKTD